MSPGQVGAVADNECGVVAFIGNRQLDDSVLIGDFLTKKPPANTGRWQHGFHRDVIFEVFCRLQHFAPGRRKRFRK
jgi:hypothetical protein